MRIVPWCNGSTSDFGSVSPGSNPSGTTILKQTVFINRIETVFLFYGYSVIAFAMVGKADFHLNVIAKHQICTVVL